MLSALLGAICAASMAFAPMLVEPSSNISNNDGDFTSVHGAYYDADNASGYGTTAAILYNYSSLALSSNFEATEGVESVSLTSTGSTQIYLLDYTCSNSTECNEVIAELQSGSVFDFYLGGTLMEQPFEYGYVPRGSYYIYFNVPQSSYASYIWAFDHYVEPYHLGTDTVVDIAEGLTDGIGTVATGIGGGLQSLVRNIFLVGTYDGEGNFTATGLSTFGIVTIVMASLALALGLSRWVVGWASSLGERNR